jgi:hypothetical protein
MAIDDSAASILERIRGSLKPARANARTVAALTDNPGCTRRRVIDAAGVRAFDLADQLGHPVTRGQSPFAITSGNGFEYRLKKGSAYALLVESISRYVELPAMPNVVDLGFAKGVPIGTAALKARANETEKILASIARGEPSAPHIVDHPILWFEVAGTPVFLEPDALAFRIGTKLELVEIKSYPIIDEQADPAKLAATAGQAAVYVLALRATLIRLGLDPGIVTPSVILVAPRNFGRKPTAHRVPLRKRIMALERVLGAVPKTDALLSALKLPRTFTLDVAPSENKDEADSRDSLERAVKRLPMLYAPECLAACDMARFCRHQAIVEDIPARIGRSARDSLAGVDALRDALRLATKGPTAGEKHLADVAETLQSAARALARARAAAPKSARLEAPPGRGACR